MRPLSRQTILHIAPTPFFSNRGCHIRIKNAVTAGASQGFRCIVCTYHHGMSPRGIVLRRIWKIPGYRQTSAGYSPFKFIADVYLFLLVLHILKKEQPGLIHAHLHEGALLGWAARHLLPGRKPPMIMDMQGSLSGELAAYGTFDDHPWIVRLFQRIEGWICRLPDRFACSSTRSRDILRETFGVPTDRVVLMPDAVPSFFFDQPPHGHPKTRFRIPPEMPVIIYSGSLLSGKGIGYLLAAMDRLLLDDACQVYFVVVGYPTERVQQHVTDKGYGDRCCLTGEVSYEQLPVWLSAADIAVEPKLADGGEASGKILHYMAAGLPVVCFDTSFHRALLGENGYFASPGNTADFVEKIKLALSAPETARAKGEQGKQYARAHFSLEAAGGQLAALYRQMLGSDCGRTPG